VIERLLQAEAALDKGLLDVAGRLYHQVAEADPRNAIALVGLARIALREDRFSDARELAEQALALDPQEAAAQRVLREAFGEAAAAEPMGEPEQPRAAAAALAAAQRRLLETREPAGTQAPAPNPGSPTGVTPGASAGKAPSGGPAGNCAPAASRRPDARARRSWRGFAAGSRGGVADLAGGRYAVATPKARRRTVAD